MSLDKQKWGVELGRTVIVSAFIAGTLWANLNGKVTALEDKDSPTRKEFDSHVTNTAKHLDGLPPKHQVVDLQKSLTRIEKQLNDALPRLVTLERDVAVISATYKKQDNAR